MSCREDRSRWASSVGVGECVEIELIPLGKLQVVLAQCVPLQLRDVRGKEVEGVNTCELCCENVFRAQSA